MTEPGCWIYHSWYSNRERKVFIKLAFRCKVLSKLTLVLLNGLILGSSKKSFLFVSDRLCNVIHDHLFEADVEK